MKKADDAVEGEEQEETAAITDSKSLASQDNLETPDDQDNVQAKSQEQQQPDKRKEQEELDDEEIGSDLDSESDEDYRKSDPSSASSSSLNNQIVGLYDSVQRTRNHWRCKFIAMAAHIDGRDYLFNALNGDFEWWIVFLVSFVFLLLFGLQ